MLSADSAGAATPPPWLEGYHAPAACPSASSFSDQVEQRLSSALEALERARVSVEISRGETRPEAPVEWRAALSIDDASAGSTTGEVADLSCSALVQALALLVALRIDAAPEPAAPLAPRLEPDSVSPRDAPSPSAEIGAAAPAFRFGAGLLITAPSWKRSSTRSRADQKHGATTSKQRGDHDVPYAK